MKHEKRTVAEGKVYIDPASATIHRPGETVFVNPNDPYVRRRATEGAFVPIVAARAPVKEPEPVKTSKPKGDSK